MTQEDAGDGPPGFKEADCTFDKGPASETVLSLSQALLAPLDAILKAQVHAARSFLSFLLQIGYPHRPAPAAQGAAPPAGGSAQPGASSATPAPEGDEGVPYQMDFYHDAPNLGRQKISIPTLALVPLNPLGVKEAEFQFDFYVRQISRHNQMMAADKAALEKEKVATEEASTGPMDRQTRPAWLRRAPAWLRELCGGHPSLRIRSFP